MSLSPNDFDKSITDLTCRVCLNVEELMVNIYDEVEDFQSNLIELLESCGGLLIDRFDSLPKFLCRICTEELLIAAKFREKCAKSNEVLSRIAIKVVSYDSPSPHGDSDENEVRETDPNISLTDEILNDWIVEEDEPLEDEEPGVEYDVQQIVEVTENENFVAETSLTDLALEKPAIENAPQEPFLEVSDEFIKKENEDDLGFQTEDGSIVSNLDEPTPCVVDNAPVLQKIKTATKTEYKTKKKIRQSAPLIYNCDECGAAFSNPENLSRHFMRTHQEFNGQLYMCPNCKHSFTKKESLDNHNHCHEKNGSQNSQPKKSMEQSHTCYICNRMFASEPGLRAHMRLHSGDRPYQCSECPKSFKTQVAVALHMKRHTGQYDFECEICGKGFVESSNLKVHIRTHTGEKPHLCRVCGRRFSRVYLLQLHMRTHTGEKPYKCEICPKAYSQKCDLEIHSRTHTGLRPYVCQICFKSFVRSYALAKHVRQHRFEEETFERKDSV